MLSTLETVADQTRKAKEARLEAAAKPCQFCNKNLSKYTCPRCSVGYCSVECYRSNQHLKCLAGREKKSEEEKKKMEEVLRKYEFEAPEDGGALKFVGDPNTIAEVEGDELEKVDVDDAADTEEDEEDEDEETVRRRNDLAMRMEGLDIEEADFEEIWERLDAREREEFVRLAQELEKEEHSNPLIED